MEKPYKILFISSWFPNKVQPTNGNFVQRHAEAVSLTHSVSVLHAMGVMNQKESYVLERKWNGRIREIIVYYRASRIPIISFFRKFRAYLRGFSLVEIPDLVHANIMDKPMFFAIWLKLVYKIPFVISEHWSRYLKENRSCLTFSQKITAKIISQFAYCVMPVSRALENDLRSLGLKNDFKVVGNVVDTELFSVKRKTTDIFTFLHISNLVPIKNADKILSTAVKLHHKYPFFKLKIGGDGDTSLLLQIVQDMKAESYVEVFGCLSREEVSVKMKDSDCFILFSDYENAPCVLLESIAVGTPVIATNVGGVSEIVDEKNGCLISRQETELLRAMAAVLKKEIKFDPPENLHQNIVQHYSLKAVSRAFTKVYKKVLCRE